MVAYAAVCGRPAFLGPPPAVIVAQASDPPPPPRSLRRDLPPEGEGAILQALAKDPADRFDDAEAAPASESPGAGQETDRVTSSAPAGPSWWLVAGLGAATLGAAAGATLFWRDAAELDEESTRLEDSTVPTSEEQQAVLAAARSKAEEAAGSRTWALVLGGAAAVSAGLLVWALVPLHAEQEAGARSRQAPTLRPVLAPGGAGWALEGSF